MTKSNDDSHLELNEMIARKAALPNDSAFDYFTPFHDAKARQQIEAMADQLGIAHPQILQMDPEFVARTKSGAGFSQISKTGTTYIVLDSRLNAVQAKAVAAHELGHLAHGDRLLGERTNEESIEDERRADRTAAFLCQGKQNAAFMKQTAYQDGAGHPSLNERIQTFIDNAALMEMKGTCQPITLEEQQAAGAPTTNSRPQSLGRDK